MNAPAKNSIGQRCLSGIRDAYARWKEFWFSAEDPITLGMIRFLTGWMLAYNLLVWGSDLQAFFFSDGLQPLNSILKFHEGQYVFSFLFYVPDEWLAPVHWTCFGVALMFCVGLGTRVTSILAYIITVSYSQRVPVANFGLDQILGLLCLYLAIGPSGAALSVDSWLRKRRMQAAGLPDDVCKAPVKSASCRMSLRLIQIHLCVIYFWAGFAKLKGDSWWTGEAMWQVMANQEYQTIDLTWMAWVPWLPYVIAHVTVAWEVFFCVLVWNKTLRPLMLLMGTAMHIGIGAFLGMWTFGLIMTFAYFSFADTVAWRVRIDAVLSLLWPNRQVSLESPEVASNKSVMDGTQPATTVSSLASELNSEAGEDVEPVFANAESLSAASAVPTAKLIANSYVERAADLADRVLRTETELLLVSGNATERDTLRQYFRRHDIPCRAASNSVTAVNIATGLQPAAIVVSGSHFRCSEIRVLLDDLADATNAAMLVILSASQIDQLSGEKIPARILDFPVSPRTIREELNRLLFAEDDAQQHEIQSGTLRPPGN